MENMVSVIEDIQAGEQPASAVHLASDATTYSSGRFDVSAVIQHLRHYLPAQSSLKDFIHHNSLHAFQHLKFYPAIFQAAGIFGFQVTLRLEEYRRLYHNNRIRPEVLDEVLRQRKGVLNDHQWKDKMLLKSYSNTSQPLIGRLRAQWREKFHFDVEAKVQPLLFRVLSSYLDQGVATWKFPIDSGGFLATIRKLEGSGKVSLFKTKRARRLLFDSRCDIPQLLKLVVGSETYFSQYLFDQQFSHQGWSGFISSLEDKPEALLDPRPVTLSDLIAFELLLELDALDYFVGKDWQPLCSRVDEPPIDFFQERPIDEFQEVCSLWQDAFEWSYYDAVLAGMTTAAAAGTDTDSTARSFQAVFCIDERECSLRRHLECSDSLCETLGAPGFFGVEFYFQPEYGKFYEKLCPAPVTPKYLIKEFGTGEVRAHELLYSGKVQRPIHGFFSSLTLGFLAGTKIFQHLFFPKMSPAISNAFAHMNHRAQLTMEHKNDDDRENGLQIGFTVPEMIVRVEAQLRGMGLVKDFAPIVYIIAHGSSSANNPHHGAHDCGACSGRPGSVNARVFAYMANHPEVRAGLRHNGLHLPVTTQFVGGMHDTAADEIDFFDEDNLTPQNTVFHQRHKKVFETALDLNAKERSRRFASIKTKGSIHRIRKAIKERSVSLFEPRPELGHGTNALCVVGRRALTKKLFLDRRAFLNSYDYRTDPEGKLLPNIMRPLGPVCGGINLEYYFSRVDNYKIGAGTKLPHNVVGLFGVANSSDGDLRPGLPLQMIEVHDPVRLLIVVEHFPEVVLSAIQSSTEMYEWYINNWVHLVAVHPETAQCYYFKEGKFSRYTPLSEQVVVAGEFHGLVETAQEMKTNRIEDATKENLPVMILN
jgi:hypothetical protein